MTNSPVETLYTDPNNQVILYQSEDRYLGPLKARFGQRFATYRQQWAQARDLNLPFPLSLDLEINTGCQLGCLMCVLAKKPKSPRRLMADRLYENILSQAAEQKLPALTFGFLSEPLLHPKIAARVYQAVKIGVMDIRLGTNGQALSPELSEKLIYSGLTRLEVSVDAETEGTYKAIRAGGDFYQLRRNIDDFLNRRSKAGQIWPLLRVSFIKLKENQAELEPFIKHWSQWADLISVQEAIWFPDTNLEPGPPNPLPLVIGCQQSWQRLIIRADGEVWPCCSLYGQALSLGRGTDLSNLWRSAIMNQLRKSLKGPAQAAPQACQTCHIHTKAV